MIRIAPLLILLGLTITSAQAQTPPTTTTEAGRLILQFSNAIRPTSYTDHWLLKTSSWKSTAAKTNSGIALAKNASFLANYIKPGMFKTSFDLKNFNKTANSAKTYPDAYKVLQTLEDGLKPEALGAYWRNQRGHWLHDLSVLK
jgi:hypothetical protein